MFFEKLRVPVMIAIAGLSAAVGVGASWAATKGRVDQNSERIAQLSQAREDYALRLQAIEIELRHMNSSLNRIEKHLEAKP